MTKARELANFSRGLPLALGYVRPSQLGIVGDVIIPTHFDNLQSAFNTLGPGQPEAVNILIQSGHSLSSGVFLSGGDWSKYTISSQDSVVSLSPGFIGASGVSPFSANSLFVGRECKAPRWSTVVDMGDLYGCGLVYERQTVGIVSNDCGVINSGAFGLYVNTQSDVHAANANFSGSGWGSRVTLNSRLNAPQANFSGAKNSSYLSTNTVANLDVSRGCVVYVTGTTAAPTNMTNGAGRGLAVRRSFVSATDANVSGCGLEGLRAENNSVVSFDRSIANDCGINGVVADGSLVSMNGGASATGNSNFNLLANQGGQIFARDGVFTGGGVQGVRAAQGSKIVVNGSNCRRNGVSNQNSDIHSTEGSQIVAVGALGGTNILPMEWGGNGQIITQSDIRKIVPNAIGGSPQSIDFDFPGALSDNVTVRFFRDTVSSGNRRAQFFRGDGTNTLDAQIGVGGQISFFNSGNTGIGTSDPQQKLHVSGNVRVDGQISGVAVTQDPTDTTAGRLLKTGSGVLQAYRAGNLLGTVSQTAGVPTGAVIQRGSNANGEFVRFADGTQICTARRVLTVTTSLTDTVTFAAGFVAESVVLPIPDGNSPDWNDTNDRFISVRQRDTGTSGTRFLLSAIPAGGNFVLKYTAFGRWF